MLCNLFNMKKRGCEDPYDYIKSFYTYDCKYLSVHSYVHWILRFELLYTPL